MADFPARVQAPKAPAIQEQAPWACESLFGRWSRHCLQRSYAGGGLTGWLELIPRAHPVLDVLPDTWFTWRPRGGDAPRPLAMMAKMLGWTPDEMRGATGSGLAPRSAYRDEVLPACLRFCPTCLKHGFHSYLYQHLAVASCPIHARPFATACPQCGKKMHPTFASVMRAPFCCDNCSHLLIGTAAGMLGSSEMSVLRMLLTDIARDLHVSPDEATRAWSSLPLVQERESAVTTVLPEAVVRRRLQRWQAWPAIAGRRWPHFGERDYLLTDWCAELPDYWPGPGAATRAAGTHALHRLWEICHCHADYSDLLRWHLGLRDTSRLDGKASVVAAALHLTMVSYAQSGSPENLVERVREPFEAYADVVWNGRQLGGGLAHSDAGNALLVQYEIFGAFALNMLRVRRIAELRDVEWHQGRPPATAFAPAWRVLRLGSRMVLRVRARVDERLARRLCHRYPRQVLLRKSSPDLATLYRDRRIVRLPLERLPRMADVAP